MFETSKDGVIPMNFHGFSRVKFSKKKLQKSTNELHDNRVLRLYGRSPSGACSTLTLTVDGVTGLQTELSERVRRRRRTRLTLRSPSRGHRATAVGFCHGLMGHGTCGVTTAVSAVVGTPAVQQVSVAISDPRILRKHQNTPLLNNENFETEKNTVLWRIVFFNKIRIYGII